VFVLEVFSFRLTAMVPVFASIELLRLPFKRECSFPKCLPPITPTIHLVLQGKGGVGKSVVASWLAEFLVEQGQTVRCIDGDPVNRSLAQFKALDVEKADLLNQEGVVLRCRYDALVNRFLREDSYSW